MRCGLSPIVAMREMRGAFYCGEQERICYLLGIFTVFFRFIRESEPFYRESEALSSTAFQYNGHTCPSIGLARRESEPFCHEFKALSPAVIVAVTRH